MNGKELMRSEVRGSFLQYSSRNGISSDGNLVFVELTIESPNKTEVESVPRINVAWTLDRCRGDSCNLLHMFPGPLV